MTFGTQTFGTETYNSGTSFSIIAVSPIVVSREGGTKMTLTGVFPASVTYLVRVDSVLAYSGVPGQGEVVNTDGTSMSFVLPALELSQIGSVFVEIEQVPGGSTAQIALEVVERYFGSAAFELRRMFPKWYAAGPRRLELEPQE